MVSALALSAHSFFDGVSIGLGFQVSTTVGLAVAVAVIAHDFSDGLNTVASMLLNGNTSGRTWRLLLLDAATPLLGAASTLLFHVPDKPGGSCKVCPARILPVAPRRGNFRAVPNAEAFTLDGTTAQESSSPAPAI